MLKNSKICFISVTLKSWSGRKLLDPTTYMQIFYDIISFVTVINGQQPPKYIYFFKYINTLQSCALECQLRTLYFPSALAALCVREQWAFFV